MGVGGNHMWIISGIDRAETDGMAELCLIFTGQRKEPLGMWYVIQTHSGNETEVKCFLEASLDKKAYRKCFVPVYEEVRHRGGNSRILFRKLFPGYLFIDIDEENLKTANQVLKRFPEFTRILGTDDENGVKLFTPIEPDEERFLETLLTDGILHVSYVETERNSKKIKRVIGPLGRYRNNITSYSTSKREAIVEITMFGRHHRIAFGLWNKDDAKLPIFETLMEKPEETVIYGSGEINTGIYPGDTVIGMGDPYDGYVFTVEKVNPIQRTIETWMELFGDKRKMTLYIDQIKKQNNKGSDNNGTP